MLKSSVFLAVLRSPALRPGQLHAPHLAFAALSRQLPKRPISTTRLLPTSPLRRSPLWRLQPRQRIRNNSSKSSASAAEAQVSKPPESIRERFKQLSKKYGWAAVGVYFGLSLLDFPFCFLAVKLIGPDRIGAAEHFVVNGFWNLVAIVMPSMAPGKEPAIGAVEAAEAEASETRPVDVNGHKSKENASIWTQLLLAYGVHKSLIFFRVPLTAAVTPKVVKTLRGWGWNIGPRVKGLKNVPRDVPRPK